MRLDQHGSDVSNGLERWYEMAAEWFVIHTYSGQESRAKQALLERARAHDREAAIHEILIPEESVVEVVKGERRTSKRKFLPH